MPAAKDATAACCHGRRTYLLSAAHQASPESGVRMSIPTQMSLVCAPCSGCRLGTHPVAHGPARAAALAEHDTGPDPAVLLTASLARTIAGDVPGPEGPLTCSNARPRGGFPQFDPFTALAMVSRGQRHQGGVRRLQARIQLMGADGEADSW